MTRRRARRLAAVTFAAAAVVYTAATIDAATASVELAGPADQRTATQVREWMVRQGFPVYNRPVYVADHLDSPYSGGWPVVGTATPDGPVVVRTVTTGPDSRWSLADILIHEYLHSLRNVRDYHRLSAGERIVEEGVVTAVTEDLSPRFACAVWGECGPSGWLVFSASGHPYDRWAAMVRGVSARATRRPVNSREARAWRYQLVKADRAARAVMWARATGGAR